MKFRFRPDRPAFLGRRLRSYLVGKVLDVGCDQAVLREIVGADHYNGVGMTEEADTKLDLERPEGLPFEDASWDTVVCFDVLEHVNNLHHLCDELFRVARTYVILSLPNCWSSARKNLARGKGSIWHYGLPLKKPPDRHKWFFNTEEAYAFLLSRLSNPNRTLQIRELLALENRRPLINRIWRRIKYPSPWRYLNLYPHSLVCVYELGPRPE